MQKTKKFLILILLLLCTLFFCGVFHLSNKQTAQAFSYSQGGKLGVLYDYSGKTFSKTTLDNIAKSAGNYSNVKELIDDVTQNNLTVQANVFGTQTLYLGKNAGTGADLEWQPAYISKDDNGNAVLTLWLSYFASSGTYEVASFSDGTRNDNGSTNPPSNMYSSSYMHALINNGYTYSNGVYFGNYVDSTSKCTPQQKVYNHLPDNKFVEFTGDGVFSEFIVAPKNVGWQMAESAYKNDPANGVYANRNGNNYLYNGWTDDNLWLPSISETGANDTNITNGIWNPTADQRAANVTVSAMRTGSPSNYIHLFALRANGAVFSSFGVNGALGVRPAFHLNLNKALDSLCKHTNATAVVTPPTCEEKGYTTFNCGDCGKTFIDNYTEPKGHNYGSLITANPATCTESGNITHYKCSDCGKYFDVNRKEITASQAIIPANGHSLIPVEGKQPTCSETGWKPYVVCSVCGYSSFEELPIDPTAHKWDEGTATTPAGCVTAGIKTFCCEYDGSHSYTEPIPATGHNMQYVAAKAATCAEAGWYAHVACSGCDYSTKREIPALEHNYKESVSAEATCETDGYTGLACTRCGDIKKLTETEAFGHDYQDEVIAPDCEEQGYTLHTCSNCGNSYEDNYVNALGHLITAQPNWIWADDYYSATVEFNCSRCGVNGVRIAAQVTAYNQEATCESEGIAFATATVIWNGQTFSDTVDEILTKLPHAYVEGDLVWAEDYSSASITYTCSNCGNEHIETAASSSERSAESCTQSGTITYSVTINFIYPDIQSVFGEYTEELNATGHSYKIEWIWENGGIAIAKFTCSVCEDIQRVPAVVETEILEEATEEQAGTVKYTANVEFGGETYTDELTEEYNLGDLENPGDVCDQFGHSYRVSGWSWADDYSSATVILKCVNCGNEQPISAEITKEILTEATEEHNGEIRYTATANYESIAYTDEKTVEYEFVPPEEITVTIESAVFEYSGEACSVTLICSNENLTNEDFEIQYSQDGLTWSSSAPIDAGIYSVKVTLLNEKYILSGETQFEFEISPQQILVNWHTAHVVPPMLQLTVQQVSAVGYTYYDEEGNEVAFENLVAGTYTVKAFVKEEYKNNYKFIGELSVSEFESEIHSFTVTENDELVHPDDLENPKNPNNPDNNLNEDNENGDSENGVSFWLWVCIALIVIVFIEFIVTIAVIKNLRKEAGLEEEYGENDEEDEDEENDGDEEDGNDFETE